MVDNIGGSSSDYEAVFWKHIGVWFVAADIWFGYHRDKKVNKIYLGPGF